MLRENPYETTTCIYCNGYGCFCKDEHQDCVDCEVCHGTGELSLKQLDEMAESYKADERFKRVWRSSE